MMVASFTSIVRVIMQSRTYNWFAFLAVVVALIIMYATQSVGNYIISFGVGQVGQLDIIYSDVNYTLCILVETTLCLLPSAIELFLARFVTGDVSFDLMNALDKSQFNKCMRVEDAVV